MATSLSGLYWMRKLYNCLMAELFLAPVTTKLSISPYVRESQTRRTAKKPVSQCYVSLSVNAEYIRAIRMLAGMNHAD